MDPATQNFHSITIPHRINKHHIDGQALKQLVEAGLVWLKANQQTVNALNVFPVPDGDTGTNMVLTMQAAYQEIATSSDRSAAKMAQSIAHGALMGARGNSGVILSQLWRGFARGLEGQEILNAAVMARSFAHARDTAYKGVVRPVEGTILTVAKDAAAAAERALAETDDPFEVLAVIVKEADASVERTPDLLPVLKEAGVVDSGGKGLFYIFEGMLRYINNLPLDAAVQKIQSLGSMKFDNAMESIEPGQDYELVIDFKPSKPLELEKLYQELEEMGTSIQMGEGDGMYRLHIHVPTENRYKPIDYTMSIGTITKVAIENLIAQMEEIEQKKNANALALDAIEPGQIAVVAVAPGPGIARVFASLGVAAVVEGGQTMNPSTQEIIGAFEDLPTEKIIILPNNKNIIMAAQTASQLTVKKVAVIPTRTVPQGLAAMMRLIPDGDFDEVVEEMNQAINDVDTVEITTSTRTVEIDGVEVNEGEIIGLLNGKLSISSGSVESACIDLLKKAQAEDRELITLFYGDNIPRHEVNRIVDDVRKAFPEQEIEVQEGGQPHYFFIISIE
jgi:uncharacterized protein